MNGLFENYKNLARIKKLRAKVGSELKAVQAGPPELQTLDIRAIQLGHG